MSAMSAKDLFKRKKNIITRVDHKQNSGDIVGQSRYVLSLFLEC